MEDSPRRLDISHYFLFMLIVVCLFISYRMMAAYVHPVIFATLLSIITHPIYERLAGRFNGRKNLAAAVCCLLITFIIVIPLFFVLLAVIKQGISTVSATNQWISTLDMDEIRNLPQISGYLASVKKYLPADALANLNIYGIMQTVSANAGKMIVSNGTWIISNISAIIMNFFLMIFIYFFVVQKQTELFDYIFHLMPLTREYENILVNKIKAVSKSALLGTLVTSTAQGVAGGIAFGICGLPGFFWGAVMAFASLIPVVGTALIWVPAAGYLLLTGHIKLGLFMVVWSVIVVGMIDNLVRPLFMKGSADMNTILIFFSILGGLNLFGLAGLLYGPLIFGITLVLLYIYDLEFSDFLNHQDRKEREQKPEAEQKIPGLTGNEREDITENADQGTDDTTDGPDETDEADEAEKTDTGYRKTE